MGRTRLEQHRHSVNVSRRKAIAVLAFLAVTRRPHSRDALATLLWPDQDQSGARANLRRDLSTLRQILGDQILLDDQDQVSLNPDADLWIDTEVFQARNLDLAGVARYRVIYLHEGATGANTAIWVRGIEVSAIE